MPVIYVHIAERLSQQVEGIVPGFGCLQCGTDYLYVCAEACVIVFFVGLFEVGESINVCVNMTQFCVLVLFDATICLCLLIVMLFVTRFLSM
jgi:hypothetical protein